MIKTQWALLQREIWEHRSIYVTPAVITVVVVLLSITGQVAVSAFDQAVDLAILGASNLGERERAAAISVLSTGVSTLFIIAMSVLTIFYLLDSLYAERKDKSILFWRSLPVTDAETVVSKLITAIVVIPLATFAAAAITHLLVLLVSGIWVGNRGGDAWQLIWNAAPLLENWLATLILMLALPLWYLPFAGWFLFVSAWTKRSPFLVAFLPLVVLPMLERILIGSTLFRDAIFVRPAKMPLFSGDGETSLIFGDATNIEFTSGQSVTLLGFMDLPRFLASVNLWLGVLVGGLFVAAAIYVRRYRDES